MFSLICVYFLLKIDPLFQLFGRLKSVHNAYSLLAPIPVQISEAIMNFQERSFYFSNRIQMRCFQQKMRFKRSAFPAKDVLKEEVIDEDSNEEDSYEYDDSREEPSHNKKADASRETMLELADGNGWRHYYEESAKMADALRLRIVDYIDKLSRMRGFWGSMPSTLCEDSAIASDRHANGRCWNGTAVGRYRYRAVGDGWWWLRVNPEFQEHFAFNFNREAFLTERQQFLGMAKRLSAHYDDQGISVIVDETKAVVEASASIEENNSTSTTTDSSISVDDEDTFDSSGLSLTDLEYSDDSTKTVDQQQSSWLPQYNKLFSSIRHPTTNTTVLVTKHVPASITSSSPSARTQNGANILRIISLLYLIGVTFSRTL